MKGLHKPFSYQTLEKIMKKYIKFLIFSLFISSNTSATEDNILTKILTPGDIVTLKSVLAEETRIFREVLEKVQFLSPGNLEHEHFENIKALIISLAKKKFCRRKARILEVLFQALHVDFPPATPEDPFGE